MAEILGAHNALHSDQGALRGEHPGRSRNPLIKVADLAWPEFDKPDLSRASAFARAFGFHTTAQSTDELHPRGTDAGSPCVIIRRGSATRFRGFALRADDEADLLRLAGKTGAAMPSQAPPAFNFGHRVTRTNATQRPPREPARVQRLGHVVLSSTKYIETLDWYLDNFGLIVSDFLYFPGQRERGPTMSFIRCDRCGTPADHHTMALTLGPANRYVHSAYQVSDLDALAAGGEYLREQGYRRSWGIGRHIQGSQLFDYWRDPDGFLVEHFADGALFDYTVETGWAPFTASGLAQWGPPVSRDFLGTDPKHARDEFGAIVTALRESNEFNVRRLIGLLKVARS